MGDEVGDGVDLRLGDGEGGVGDVLFGEADDA